MTVSTVSFYQHVHLGVSLIRLYLMDTGFWYLYETSICSYCKWFEKWMAKLTQSRWYYII